MGAERAAIATGAESAVSELDLHAIRTTETKRRFGFSVWCFVVRTDHSEPNTKYQTLTSSSSPSAPQSTAPIPPSPRAAASKYRARGSMTSVLNQCCDLPRTHDHDVTYLSGPYHPRLNEFTHHRFNQSHHDPPPIVHGLIDRSRHHPARLVYTPSMHFGKLKGATQQVDARMPRIE